MSLKYTCPSCGTPLGYEGLCWKCKCEQERQAALAWMPEQIVEKQRNLTGSYDMVWLSQPVAPCRVGSAPILNIVFVPTGCRSWTRKGMQAT